MIWWSQQTTSISTTSGVGKQEKEGLSDITLEKGAYRAHIESRKICLVAATVSEPGETHGAGTQTSKETVPPDAWVSEEVWRLFCECCKSFQTGFSCHYWNALLLSGWRNKAAVMLKKQEAKTKPGSKTESVKSSLPVPILVSFSSP